MLIVLLLLAGSAVAANAIQASSSGPGWRREQVAATRRAVEEERARIAGELHDVVTHNVSVMVVQAGAARQVLDSAPSRPARRCWRSRPAAGPR